MCGACALEDPELPGLVGRVKAGVAWTLGVREHGAEGREDRLR